MLLLVFRKICTIISQCSWHAFLFVGAENSIFVRKWVCVWKSVISLSLSRSQYARFLDRFFNRSTLRWSHSTLYLIFMDFRSLFDVFVATIVFSQLCFSSSSLFHSTHWNISPKRKIRALQIFLNSGLKPWNVFNQFFLRADGRLYTIRFIFSVFFFSSFVWRNTVRSVRRWFYEKKLLYFSDVNFDEFRELAEIKLADMK